VPPLDVGSSVTVSTTLIGPPFSYRHIRGRSKCVHAVSTTGPCFHFARNRVPTPTGPAVNRSIDTQSGFQ
jgi:hypothetical protein